MYSTLAQKKEGQSRNRIYTKTKMPGHPNWVDLKSPGGKLSTAVRFDYRRDRDRE